ncbi:MAG: hypothetical protein KatS3mg101_0882 [Patescibacteria group bacterium]|nr:MAG: hypothetical protein KatS3mg101_0882 [Patescibacteria group bacterium]
MAVLLLFIIIVIMSIFLVYLIYKNVKMINPEECPSIKGRFALIPNAAYKTVLDNQRVDSIVEALDFCEKKLCDAFVIADDTVYIVDTNSTFLNSEGSALFVKQTN